MRIHQFECNIKRIATLLGTQKLKKERYLNQIQLAISCPQQLRAAKYDNE